MLPICVIILDGNSQACSHKAMLTKANRITTMHDVMHALRHNT